MPEIDARRIGLALDVAGCPNRCRHCWLTCHANQPMDERAILEVAGVFRAALSVRTECFQVLTWIREPDFHPDYARLRELERELSDEAVADDWGLLSVWRLARDPHYADWAREHRGAKTCQITYFGTGETNDWFYRRKGAHDDCMAATEACLRAGIIPRWQLFLTKKMVPHLDEWEPLIRDLRLRERCEEIGGEFTVFIHTPSPDGEAFGLERLRPTKADIEAVPMCLMSESRRHLRCVDPLGEPEGRLVRRVLSGELDIPPTLPPQLWFQVTPSFDVYSNLGEMSPPWRLGNLQIDSITDIIRRLETDFPPAFRPAFGVPTPELARAWGQPRGRRYYTPSDLRARWVKQWREPEPTSVD